MKRIIVSGALANKLHNGGEAWVRLSWILGFQRLGFEVFFIEQLNPESCVDTAGTPVCFIQSENLAYFKRVTEYYGLEHCSALVCGEEIYGNSFLELTRIADSSDLLINISGHLTLDLKYRVRHRVFIDIDPGYTQFWEAAGQSRTQFQGHDSYFTIGTNIGTPACSIPFAGIFWRATRQPVVLGLWPVAQERRRDFSTVASWRGGYGTVTFDGTTYGQKAHEFRRFIELPKHSAHHFSLGLDIHIGDSKDLAALEQNGWEIDYARTVVETPWAFQDYIQSSAAEFSVAQGIYVDTNCGWFSDRSVRYLASGKPVLLQETGFSDHIPTGQGIVPFKTFAQAVSGAESIMSNYEVHSRAARKLAETIFDSDIVLGELLEQLGK